MIISVFWIAAIAVSTVARAKWLHKPEENPRFQGMPNLEYLNLGECTSLEEVHDSLEYCGKLIQLSLFERRSLKRFPYVNVESLESLNLMGCSSLEKFPEFLGIMKPELKITMPISGIMDLPSSIIEHQAGPTELDLSEMTNLIGLPSSICRMKGLVKLIVWGCSKLESLPEEMGYLENLEELDARFTLISRPLSSIVWLNKLRVLTFAKEVTNCVEVLKTFVFPHVNEGLRSLEDLDLSFCNLIDGGLPEDIGSLSSLEYLKLCGNNCEHVPRSIAQLDALKFLNLSFCKRLAQLPEIPQQLHTIFADWSNDSICNSLFQNISLLQHDISVSDSLSLRMLTSSPKNIPSWFHHQGMGASVSVALPENWYVSDNFLGFAVCYYGKLIDDITVHLIPLCDDGMSSMTQKFALSDHSEYGINFFLIPLGGIWDASNANGKTSNDYGCIRLYSPQERNDCGKINEHGRVRLYSEINYFGARSEFRVRLLYKDETELSIGIRKSRYEEASCSSSMKHKSQVD